MKGPSTDFKAARIIHGSFVGCDGCMEIYVVVKEGWSLAVGQ